MGILICQYQDAKGNLQWELRLDWGGAQRKIKLRGEMGLFPILNIPSPLIIQDVAWN
jgi:hypothetical protein